MIRLLGRILIICLLCLLRGELTAAVGTENCSGLAFCPAIGTIGAAAAGRYAAGRADECIRIHFSAAMSTIHMKYSFKQVSETENEKIRQKSSFFIRITYFDRFDQMILKFYLFAANGEFCMQKKKTCKKKCFRYNGYMNITVSVFLAGEFALQEESIWR